MSPRLRLQALALALYVALALLQTGLWHDLGRTFFVGPDPIVDLWTLSRVTRNALESPSHLFDGNMYYPSYDSVLFTDPLLGPAALVLPVRLVSRNPVLLYNASVLLSLVLASLGFFVLAREITGDVRASILAGVVVPYSAPVMYHVTHLNLLAIAGFPFLLLALLRLLERPGPMPALAAALAFALQAGTTGYHGLSCVLLSLIVAAWGWRRFRLAKTWAYSLLAGGTAAALLLPFILGFLRLRGEADLERNVQETATYSVDLAVNLFRSRSYAWKWLLKGPGEPLFPGLIVAFFAAVALARRRSREVGLLAIIAGTFFLLALGPELRVGGRSIFPLPFRFLFEHVPLLRSGRHPVTFATVTLMALGVLAAVGLSATSIPRRPALFALVLLAATGETLVRPPRRASRGEALPEVYSYLAGLPRGGVLELPFLDDRWQWWAAHHDLPLVNGTAAFAPRRYLELWQLVTREWKRSPPASMEDWPSLNRLKVRFPARYLVLHAEVEEAVRRNVEATPTTFELLHETADGDRVYRVRRGGTDTLVRREFRDDQLREGRLIARMRGPGGGELLARWDNAILDRRPLTAEWTDVVWVIPQEQRRRGLHMLALGADGPPGAFLEVDDLEAR